MPPDTPSLLITENPQLAGSIQNLGNFGMVNATACCLVGKYMYIWESSCSSTITLTFVLINIFENTWIVALVTKDAYRTKDALLASGSPLVSCWTTCYMYAPTRTG